MTSKKSGHSRSKSRAKVVSAVVKKPKILAEDARLRKKPKYKSFRLHKRVKHHDLRLPSWWKITKKALRLMVANKKNILKFFLIYGILYLIFVRGFSAPINVEEIKEGFSEIATEEISSVAANFTAFSLLLQSTTKASGDIAGLYQMFFLVVSTLALIWLYRQQQAGNKVTIRDAFYRGMYPIIPYILITVVIALQTLPASIGNFVFRTVIDSGLAINALEQTIWLLLFLGLLLLSAYMISSSLVALLVVTLPEMTPKIALKKAKELVEFRRFSVLRKVVALFAVLGIIFISIVFPAIFISGLLAQVLFYVLTILTIPFASAYLFVLYRELL